MSATPNQGVENPRRALLAEIVSNRNAVVVGELREGGATEEELKPLTSEPEADDPKRPADIPQEEWAQMSDEDKNNAGAKPAAEAEPATEPAAAEQTPAETPKKYKGKVDGQEVEFDEAKVIEEGLKALQKNSAADKRLEDASRTSAEAARLLKEAQETINRAALARPAQDSQATPSKDGSPIAEDALAKAAHAVQYGSEAEAKDALAGLIEAAASKGKTLTQADVIELLDYRDARQWAETEYKDVLGDPKLRTLFVSTEREKRAAGDGRPYRELYQEIGSGLREWAKGITTATASQPGTGTREDVKARKTTVVSVPTAAARQPAPQETKVPTPSETIAKMREARHQS
jgi:hypothetical protein